MAEPTPTRLEIPRLDYPDWLRLARARLCRRLAELLQEATAAETTDMDNGVRFLMAGSESDIAAVGPLYAASSTEELLHLLPPGTPLSRLVSGYALTPLEVELVFLAGLPEIHEGYADLLRMVNPERLPRTAAGLAAQLVCPDGVRDEIEYALLSGNAARSGLIRLTGDGPLFTRHLVLADVIWPVLNGVDAWPGSPQTHPPEAVDWGLEEWLAGGECRLAARSLELDRAVDVLIQTDDLETAANRAAALAAWSGRTGRIVRVNEKTSPRQLDLAGLHCRARGLLPIVTVDVESPDHARPIRIDATYPGATVIACAAGGEIESPRRSVLNINVDLPDGRRHVEIWQRALGDGRADAAALAARFPVEPHVAARVARDLNDLDRVTSTDVAKQMRARSTGLSRAGIKLVYPKAGWGQLVLPADRLARLRESVQRLHLQSRVLNDWGFLKDRQGARGVRLLFAGPPGTGKTLSAEVLAGELGVELLIVDISRVVSKWIGETEKNLERAFAVAERTRAVLLFDEADALFGKRTEVSDAHDRYANLETAYLLTRLERFEGLAVMSTNLRTNIDTAFTRRLEYVIDFNEPDRRERLAIWRCHVPGTAPLNGDVNFAELAATFPVVGGVIRNAALTAAFRAAAEDRPICRSHFIHALKQEYEKQGKSFPLSRQADGPPAT